MIDDANLTWTWPDDHFDYIHVRNMYGCIADWDAFYAEAFRCLKPGGYIEDHVGSAKWQCADDTITDASALGQWGKVFWEGGKKFGRTFRVIEDDIQRTGMTKAGFADLEVREWKVPATAWPDAEAESEMKNIGAYIQLAFDEDLEGWLLYMWNAVMGWSREEVMVYLAHFRQQRSDPRCKPWHLHRCVVARKPERE